MEIPNQRRQPVFFDLPEHRISVISTPKCASSSLLKLLGPLLPEDVELGGNPQSVWKDYSIGARELWDLKPDRFILGTVRNPWARVVSHYKDKVVAQLHDRLEQYGFRKGMPFEDYLALIDRDYDIIKDFHVKRQVDILYFRGCLLPDFILRTERFAEDASILSELVKQKTGATIDTGVRLNKTGGGDFRARYTNQTKGIVRRLYGQDIETFCYHFGQ